MTPMGPLCHPWDPHDTHGTLMSPTGPPCAAPRIPTTPMGPLCRPGDPPHVTHEDLSCPRDPHDTHETLVPPMGPSCHP